MLPIVATINNFVPIQAPLINTTIPGSDAARVPYDNVAPSVSSAQVDNNASSNNAFAAAADETPAIATDTTTADTTLASSLSAQSQGATTSATFLTQLLAEDLSPPTTQVILVQYEKLIALSNVKYKPSNALKPQPAPADAFGQILQQEKPATPAAPPITQPVASAPQAAATPPLTQETNVAIVTPPPLPVVVAAPASNDNPPEVPAAQPVNDNTVPTPPAITAYTQTANRPVTQAAGNITELA